MALSYRLLLPDEWPRIQTIARGPIPGPETSAIAIAEDHNGDIQGFLVLQLQWHLEPLQIEHPKVSFLQLKEVLDEQLREHPGQNYYAFVDNEKVAQMAELADMKLVRKLVFQGGV